MRWVSELPIGLRTGCNGKTVRANLALPQGLAEAKAAEYMGVLEKVGAALV